MGYGDVGPYGGDAVYGGVVDEDGGGDDGGGVGHHSGCLCGEGWRFECTELGGPNAGRVKAVLHPISASWEEGYSAPTTGSILVSVQDPSQADVWGGATGLYISQVLPDGSRRCRFGGEIVTSNGVGGGAFTLGIQSIDAFLDDRLVAGPDCPYRVQLQPVTIGVYKPLPTNPVTYTLLYTEPNPPLSVHLASVLVRIARGGLEGEGFNGIPLTPATGTPPASTLGSDYDIRWFDFKNVGQTIRELVAMDSTQGMKYRLEHTFTNGYWSSVIRFEATPTFGTARNYTIRSDIEAKEYGLSVDASEKATRVYGVGGGDEDNTLFSVAYDADQTDNLPERHATVAWKDIDYVTPGSGALDSLTQGYVTDHRDPVTVPSATLYGLPDYDSDAPDYDPQKGFPGPEILLPGDTFTVDIGYGAITVRDLEARCLAVSWELASGAPAKRTIAMQPVERANNSIRTQTPARIIAPTEPIPEIVTVPVQAQSIPWPVPGLVSRSQSADLTEISGMQYSAANPGYIWVVEDEKETPDQVSLLNRATGARVGYFNITGVSGGNVGDPEAIRLARSTGKLVIADIGDNDANRPTSGANQPSLLVVVEPKGGGVKGTLPTTRYPIAYPAGLQVNAETLLIHPTTEQVYIVTKEASQARVYSYGALSSMSTANNVGTLVATITNTTQVSDGTHTFAGDFILFRSASTSATQVYSPSWKRVGQLATPAMVKSEAITVESACAFLTTTEGANAPIYRVLIPTKFGATCNTVTGPVGTGTGGQTGPNGPKVVPGQVLDMKQWKLQLPI